MQDTDIDAAALHLHALQSAAQRGLRLPVHLRPREPIDGWRIQRRVSALRARPVHGWKCALPPADRWVVAALHDVWPSPAGLRAPAGSPGVARVEPEFAFEFTSTLPARSAPYAEHEVDRAVGAVRLAVEVLGCRFAEPAEASGPELMADSLWHHALVLGGRIKGALPEAPRFTLRVIRPDAPAIVLAAAHADGNPRRALYWLVEFLRQQGLGIEAGQAVITGSLAGVIELPFGQAAEIHYGELGSVALTLASL